jgi:hypothetical protein
MLPVKLDTRDDEFGRKPKTLPHRLYMDSDLPAPIEQELGAALLARKDLGIGKEIAL